MLHFHLLQWPFARFYGIQEPASAIFSLFNGLTHMMIFKFRAKVSSAAPMYYAWHAMAIVSLHFAFHLFLSLSFQITFSFFDKTSQLTIK